MIEDAIPGTTPAYARVGRARTRLGPGVDRGKTIPLLANGAGRLPGARPGAIVVDTWSRPTDGGHPFGYLAAEWIEQLDAEALRMVRAYDPSREFVATLIKKEGRMSTYRIGIPSEREDALQR